MNSVEEYDFVKVVRCKNCEYCVELPKGASRPAFCSKYTHYPYYFWKGENWFCGDGEKRKIKWHKC